MAQNFIACDREQELLLPPSLREWLPEDHFAWFVLDAVEEMDLAEFYAVYREDGHGRAAHESLARAIAGIEKVFLLCGPTAQEVQLNRNAIDAARESGSSSWCEARILGSDPSSPATFVRDHGACDRYLVEVTYRP